MNANKAKLGARPVTRIGVVMSVVALLISGLVASAPAFAACAQGTSAVTTDQSDYGPGETVHITGSGFACSDTLTVKVVPPDGTTVSWSVTTDATDGSLATTYQIGTENVAGPFDLSVEDASGNVLATAVFYDSHFRFGHLNYTRTGPTSVEFTLKNAFRRNAYGCRAAPSGTFVACTGPGGRAGPGDYIVETVGNTRLLLGDGTSTPTLFYRVDAIDVAGDWLLGSALHPGTTNTVISKTYSGTGPFMAKIDSCCRTGSERNNPNGAYKVEALVAFGDNTSNPKSSLPAVVDCPINAVCNFPIPAADPDGNDISFRLSTSPEASTGTFFRQPGPPFAPNAASIGAATGIYSWNTTSASGGAGSFYSTQVTIEERNATGTLVSKSAVDFLIRLVAGSSPVFDVPPTPTGSTILSVNAGAPVTFPVQASDADPGQTVSVGHLGLPSGAALTCPTPANPTSCNFAWTPTVGDAGSHIISFTAQDSGGLNALPLPITIEVNPNATPAVDAGADATIDEGSAFSRSGSFTDDSANWTATVDYGDGSGVQSLPLTGNTFALDHVYADDGVYTVTVTVDDDGGLSGTDTVEVTVNNVAPTITALNAPSDPIAINNSVAVAAPFTDPGTLDTHTCTINWGDGSSTPGSVAGGTCTGDHVFTAAGVYTLRVDVIDDDGGTDDEIFQYVVVYDPDAGFVTGGGWIDSPAGAYAADPSLTGKAHFGFVSKYHKGATVPSGNTQFQFQTGSLNFHSSSYDWLVISGPRAQYKGSGTINGDGDYGFMLTANDGQVNGGGGVDRFRIKIWDKATGTVVYDNQTGSTDDAPAGDAIEGGSIVIHKK